MKSFIKRSSAIAALGILVTTAAFADWKDFQGCYSTVTYNGQPGSSEVQDWGRADPEANFGFATMPGQDHIAAFEFMLFKYRQGDTSYMDMAWIFPDYGTTQISTDGKTRTWSFSGPMICTGLCNAPTNFTMNTQVEITDLGNDQYRVHNFRKIPELPNHSMDADDIYVVKRERNGCATCVQNPDGSTTCSMPPSGSEHEELK
jgi:hypothetical protein